jgi:hypothetical protein
MRACMYCICVLYCTRRLSPLSTLNVSTPRRSEGSPLSCDDDVDNDSELGDSDTGSQRKSGHDNVDENWGVDPQATQSALKPSRRPPSPLTPSKAVEGATPTILFGVSPVKVKDGSGSTHTSPSLKGTSHGHATMQPCNHAT